jgi:effector-binding domain-containing protein
MIIKETQPFNALTFTTQATLPELSKYGLIGQKLCSEAERLGIQPGGALQWNYFGIDGKPETVFTLEIALPVQEEKIEVPGFEWKQVPSFKCLSLVHEGPWENLPQSYNKAMGYLAENGLSMTYECREVYLTMNPEKGADNTTEIQIGIR